MPRKKSAAKKAAEASKLNQNKLNDKSNESNDQVKLSSEAPQKNQELELLSDEESSSSDEDEYGELITDSIEKGIEEVLRTIKKDPKKLLDPSVNFFPKKEGEESNNDKKEKPIYLKDYHRMNLLNSVKAGKYVEEEEVNSEIKTYDQEQKEERDEIISHIQNQFSDDEEEDFLQKKKIETSTEAKPEERVELPDPEDNSEAFLSQFLDKQAWIPRKDDKLINLDQIDNNDEQLFDDAVEQFENAYNFRYEDPTSAEIVSYARNLASVRRENTNSRKRKRDKKRESKMKEEKEKELAIKKKKTSKINKVYDRLVKIREAVGEDVSEERIKEVFGDALLDDDFDNGLWDQKMAEIFDEEFYNDEVSKPKWDNDDEIMNEFHAEEEADDESEKESESGVKNSEENFEAKPEKVNKKLEKKNLRKKAESIVESNALRIVDEVEDERGRSKEDVKFRYRDVSPEAFGLTTRDIIMADDKDLNSLIGVKRLAPYRPKELITKDRRKYAKKQKIAKWRQETFKNSEFPTSSENDIWIQVQPKKQKSSKI